MRCPMSHRAVLSAQTTQEDDELISASIYSIPTHPSIKEKKGNKK